MTCQVCSKPNRIAVATLTQPSQKLKPSSGVREPQAPSVDSLIPAPPKADSRAEAGNPGRKKCPELSWSSSQAVPSSCWWWQDTVKEPRHSSWQFISTIKVFYPSIKSRYWLWIPLDSVSLVLVQRCWQRGLQGSLCEARSGLSCARHDEFQTVPEGSSRPTTTQLSPSAKTVAALGNAFEKKENASCSSCERED